MLSRRFAVVTLELWTTGRESAWTSHLASVSVQDLQSEEDAKPSTSMAKVISKQKSKAATAHSSGKEEGDNDNGDTNIEKPKAAARSTMLPTKKSKTSSKKKVVLPSSDNSSDDDNEVICDDTDSDKADESNKIYLRLRRSEKAAQASLDDDMVGKFCVYYDESKYWGKLQKVFAHCRDTAADQVEIKFIHPVGNIKDTFDFSKQDDSQIVDSR